MVDFIIMADLFQEAVIILDMKEEMILIEIIGYMGLHLLLHQYH
jgi:hypothetical protein